MSENMRAIEDFVKGVTVFPYEIHITVEKNPRRDFVQDCKTLELKPIILDLGLEDYEDFMTTSRLLCNFQELEHYVDTKRYNLMARGWNILRVKVETVPWHPMAVANFDPNSYYEAHIPLKIVKSFKGLHFSRNKMKVGNDSVSMATFRLGVSEGLETFKTMLEDYKTQLESLGEVFDKPLEIEYAFLDTNVDHDKEWMGLC